MQPYNLRPIYNLHISLIPHKIAAFPVVTLTETLHISTPYQNNHSLHFKIHISNITPDSLQPTVCPIKSNQSFEALTFHKLSQLYALHSHMSN